MNTVAGGGSLATISALLLLGVPVPEANATNRVGVLAQSLTASARFRAHSVDGGGDLAPQIAVSALGAALGSALALRMSPEHFERALGIAMLFGLVASIGTPKRFQEAGPPSPLRWPALFLATLYGGFAQVGVGILLLPCLVRLGGLPAVEANARKALLVAVLNLQAAAVYAWAGLVDWKIGLWLSITSAIGGWIGVKLTVGYGPKLVWTVLVLAVAVTAWRLVF